MGRALPALLCILWLTPACMGEMGNAVDLDEEPGAIEHSIFDRGDGSDGESCGDERRPVELEPEAVINGSATWDPAVADLSEGQALAVGAVMKHNGSGWSNTCTGTLIAPRVVLTAAHCLVESILFFSRDYEPHEIRFALGDNAAAPVETFTVESIAIHPRYQRRTLGGDATFDVGLLALAEDATQVLPGVRPIPINCEPLHEDTLEGQRIQAGGFGMTAPPSLEYDVPHNWQRHWTVLTVLHLSRNDMVLTGSGDNYTCKGDSGGAALWTMADGRIRALGTVSWSAGDCLAPVHYSRLDNLCDFIVPHLGPCRHVTVEGSCDDNVAVFCEDDRLHEADCSARDEVCGETDDGLMRCMPTPCGDETAEGRCDGDTAIFCDNDEVLELECGSQGMYCDRNADGYVYCANDCDGLDWSGRCDGDSALWCEGGRLRARHCGDCGQSCGWVDEVNGFYCL